MKELLVINWNVCGDGGPDFLFGPNITNLMNGAHQRWKEDVPRGFPDFYERVISGRFSLYEIERKTLTLELEDRDP